MRTVITGIVVGKVAALLLMMVGLSFLFAWLIITLIGIYIQYYQVTTPCSDQKVDNSIAFWIMIGAMIPVLRIAIQ